MAPPMPTFWRNYNLVDVLVSANAVPDSAKLIMYYYSWFGDKYSPMEVNIYEMNKENLNFTGLDRST